MDLKEENEMLRDLLTQVRVSLNLDDTEYGLSKKEKRSMVDCINVALSRQAELDEQEIRHIERCITNLKDKHQNNPRMIAEVLHNIGYKRSTTKQTAALAGELSFVQEVPTHCDRILWCGRYYHLSLNQ